ncbi:MAG: hypothetical protein H6726_27225 [Sandaracinaceae bacterium]|nr:hypothetical protein [Sandaracinaceae bacterium]
MKILKIAFFSLLLVAGCGGGNGGGTDDMGPTPDSGCPVGQQPGPNGCVPVDDCGDLACAAQHRVCDTSGPVPACGACELGYFQNGNFECEAGGTCEQLACASQNRVCVMDPEPRCDESCVSGFVWDSTLGACRTPRTCADLGCASMGQGCNAETSTSDAQCVTSCPAGEGFDPASMTCFRCGSGGLASASSCNLPGQPGETGRLIVETGVANGVCFCETEPGYFPEQNHATACDADGDGWVTSAAVNSMENAQANVRVNARCALRMVGEFRLTNEEGTSLAEATAAPLPLYESPRNDGSSSATLPTYRGETVPAAVLNSFTKGCDSVTDDFNHNGLADVDEGQTDDASVTGSSSLQGYFDRYTEYAYFMELHDGYFIAGTGGAPGTYVIAERPRTGSGNGALTLEYGSGATEYWRSCDRHDDTLYVSGGATSRAGADFSCAGASGCSRAMFHHSQFRCVVGQTLGGYGSATAASAPSRVIANSESVIWNEGGANRSLGRTNDCTLESATFTHTPGFTNSDLPTFACGAQNASDNGQVAQWVVVDYLSAALTVRDGTTPVGEINYVRGCINECDELGVTSCADYDASNPHQRCWSDQALDDFGRSECGCRRTDGNGSCQPGATVACVATCGSTGSGTCTAACVPPAAAACTPPAETCDGNDNDCDSYTDEGVRPVSGVSGLVSGSGTAQFDLVGMSNGFLGVRGGVTATTNSQEHMYQLTESLATRVTATEENGSPALGAGFDRLARVSGTNTILRTSTTWFSGSAGHSLYRRNFLVNGTSDGWLVAILGGSTGVHPVNHTNVGSGLSAVAPLPEPLLFFSSGGVLASIRPFTTDTATTYGGIVADANRGISAIASPSFAGDGVVAYGRTGASTIGIARVRESNKVVQAAVVQAGPNSAYPHTFALTGSLVGVVSRKSDGNLLLYIVDSTNITCPNSATCPVELGVNAPLPAGVSEGDVLEQGLYDAVYWEGLIMVAVRTATQALLVAYDMAGTERYRTVMNAAQPGDVALAVSDLGTLAYGMRHGITISHRRYLTCP